MVALGKLLPYNKRKDNFKGSSMDRVLRYAAYLANVILLLVVGFILSQAYSGPDFFLALLLAVPPAMSIAALYSGADLEERKMIRRVNKARLRKELEKLEGKDA